MVWYALEIEMQAFAVQGGWGEASGAAGLVGSIALLFDWPTSVGVKLFKMLAYREVVDRCCSTGVQSGAGTGRTNLPQVAWLNEHRSAKLSRYRENKLTTSRLTQSAPECKAQPVPGEQINPNSPDSMSTKTPSPNALRGRAGSIEWRSRLLAASPSAVLSWCDP